MSQWVLKMLKTSAAAVTLSNRYLKTVQVFSNSIDTDLKAAEFFQQSRNSDLKAVEGFGNRCVSRDLKTVEGFSEVKELLLQFLLADTFFPAKCYVTNWSSTIQLLLFYLR